MITLSEVSIVRVRAIPRVKYDISDMRIGDNRFFRGNIESARSSALIAGKKRGWVITTRKMGNAMRVTRDA